MIDTRSHGQELLKEWYVYRSARPREHVLDIQSDKDNLTRWANNLQTTLLWEADENIIAEACYQFEGRLESFKEKIVVELLTGGSAG
jgi:alpha/beta superfamily hydrolase